MSAMEPDEGAQPDDQQGEAPGFDRADTDAESSDTDGSDAFDVSSDDG
jgi:hypothetical protein